MKNRFRTWRYWRDEWVNPLFIAFILAMLIRTFIMQPFKIPSTSMYPTLKVGDRIFVNKFLYGVKIPFINKWTPKVRDPKRGDIVVFVSVTDPDRPQPEEDYVRLLGPLYFNKVKKYPKLFIPGFMDGPRYLVKRLIGLPGDKVSIKNGDVYINGKVLDNPLIIKKINYYNGWKYGGANTVVKVPEDHFFMLGDNSANSLDSREWGFVPRSHLTGKVIVIWWPLNRIRLAR